jgi:hypothetical protein
MNIIGNGPASTPKTAAYAYPFSFPISRHSFWLNNNQPQIGQAGSVVGRRDKFAFSRQLFAGNSFMFIMAIEIIIFFY